MNKKVIIVIVVLLLLGIVGYFLMGKGKGPAGTPIGQNSAQPGKVNSLKSLLGLGTAQTCTFKSEGNQGTVYVAGGKVRGDFDSTVEGKTTKSHMIVDGTTSYLWMEGEKTGFKMSFDPNQETGGTESANTTSAQAFDASKDMNYDCKPWITDSGMFTLPAGVKFTEFAIPSIAPAASPASGSSGSSSSQCSYCDSLTGDAKTQCRSALNCN